MKYYGVLHGKYQSYSSIARKLLGELRVQMGTTGQKFGSWNRKLSDGAILHVSIIMNGAVPIYKAMVRPPLQKGVIAVSGDVYLETGAYKILYLFSEITDPYADFYIGTPVEAAYTSGFGPNGKINLVDFTGDIDSVAWVDGTESPKPANVGAMSAAYYVPASSFTGKLRLYIQSIYGSKRADYSVDVSGYWAALTVGGTEIEYSGKNSHWLITTEDYHYYLCRLSDSDLNASTITFEFRELVELANYEDQVSVLRAKLVAEHPGTYNAASGAVPSAQAVIEGLLLSLLKPATAVHQTVTVSAPSDGGIPFGSFLGYGWHAKYGGDEVQATTLLTDHVSYGVANHKVTLTVSSTIGVDGAVSFSAGASSSGYSKMLVQNDIFVWVPDGTASQSLWLTETFYFCGVTTGDEVIVDPPEFWTNFEIFGWYDEADGWVSCTISRIDAGDASIASSPVSMILCGEDEKSQIWSSSTPEFVDYEVSVGGDTQTVRTFSNESIHQANWKTSQGGSIYTDQYAQALRYLSQSGCPDTEPTFPGFSQFQTYCMDIDHGVYNFDKVRLNGLSQYGRVMLSLVLGDCDAAVYGAHEASDGDTSYFDIAEWVPTGSGDHYYPLFVTKYRRYDGACQETLWSTLVENRKQLSGSGSIPGTVTTPIYAPDSASSYVAFQNKIPGINVLHSEETGNDAAGVYADAIEAALGSYDILPPGLPENTDYASGLDLLFEAPLGICSAGNRALSQLGVALTSSVAGSLIGHGYGELGSQMESLNTDTYPTIDTFCGWA